MVNKNFRTRIIIIFILIAALFLIMVFRLANLQIVNGSTYREISENRMIRSYPIKAPRGEIFDTYGRPLVSNSMGYIIQIQSMDKKNSTLNETILKLFELIEGTEVVVSNDFPIKGMPYRIEFSSAKDDKENN